MPLFESKFFYWYTVTGGVFGRQSQRVVSVLVIISMLSAAPIGYQLVVLNVPAQVLVKFNS